MHNRYSDFEELRPTGEASHVPDTRLDDGCEGDPQWQRVATSAGGYPDAPAVSHAGSLTDSRTTTSDSQIQRLGFYKLPTQQQLSPMSS
jgi:hypothetical protein